MTKRPWGNGVARHTTMKDRIMPIVIEGLKANPDGIIARDLVGFLWESRKLNRNDNIGVDRLAMWLKTASNVVGEHDNKAGCKVYRWVGQDA